MQLIPTVGGRRMEKRVHLPKALRTMLLWLVLQHRYAMTSACAIGILVFHHYLWIEHENLRFKQLVFLVRIYGHKINVEYQLSKNGVTGMENRTSQKATSNKKNRNARHKQVLLLRHNLGYSVRRPHFAIFLVNSIFGETFRDTERHNNAMNLRAEGFVA